MVPPFVFLVPRVQFFGGPGQISSKVGSFSLTDQFKTLSGLSGLPADLSTVKLLDNIALLGKSVTFSLPTDSKLSLNGKSDIGIGTVSVADNKLKNSSPK